MSARRTSNILVKSGAILWVALVCAETAHAEEFFTEKPRSGLWHKEIVYDVADQRPFWFGGTLKCENAFPLTRGAQQQEFGVSLVLKFEDGKESWKPFSRWNPGSHDWETTQNVYYPPKNVKSVTVRVRADPGPGSASYRDIFVRREDPGLSIVCWRRITERPFAERDFLYVSFPRAYDWRSEAPGGLSASGKKQTRALVPIPPRKGSRVTLHLSCDGHTATKTIDCVPTALAPSPVRPGSVRIWTADSMRAVTPLTFPSADDAAQVRLMIARRGSASAQILTTTAEKETLEGVSLELSPLTTAGGVRLDGRVKWERVGYVRRHPEAIIHPMAPDREIRWLPDPLLPAAPMTVRAGSTQGAWVTVTVSPEAAPGLYRGVATVKNGARTLGKVPLAVRVLPFSQPRYFSCPSIHAIFETHVLALYGERGPQMLERLYDMVLDHRINPDGCGTRWYEPVPVETLKKWRERGMSLTAALSICKKAKRADTVWVNPPTVEETRDPAFYEAYRDRLRPYMEQVRAAGLAGCMYVYGFDEYTSEHFPGIAEFWRKFKADFPDLPMMTTAYMYRGRAEGKEVADWTVTDWHCPGMPYWRKNLSDELHSLGKQAWWYICCGPYYPRLNVGIEHPPLEGRLLTWQQYTEKCDGVFNWGINYWHRRKATKDGDPFFDQWSFGRGMTGMTGDGLMIYPGESGPLPSIRLANVRDGVQDYEWMKMAESAAGREAVAEIVAAIVPDQTHAVRDPARIHEARLKLVRILSADF